MMKSAPKSTFKVISFISFNMKTENNFLCTYFYFLVSLIFNSNVARIGLFFGKFIFHKLSKSNENCFLKDPLEIE